MITKPTYFIIKLIEGSLGKIFTITSNPNRTLSFVIPDAINPTVYVPLPRQWEHAAEIRQVRGRRVRATSD